MPPEYKDQIGNAKFDNFGDSNERRMLNSDSENLSNYSLTIGEASSLMHMERCKFASNRKVQRMCKEGRIDCWKLSTTRNGQPVAEWLVNENSLRNHIEKHEIKWDDGVAISPRADPFGSGNANVAPNGIGDANNNLVNPNEHSVEPDALAMPGQNGNANGDRVGDANSEISQANAGDDMAMPIEDGDANDREFGETRSLASLLIENAKLTAELDGKRALETEMRDEKLFLREELKEARAGRKDVAAIAERMLETLETIAIGGKLMAGSRTRHQDETKSPVSDYRASEATPEHNPSNDNSVSVHNNVASEGPMPPQMQPTFRPPSDPENPFRI